LNLSKWVLKYTTYRPMWYKRSYTYCM